MATGNIAIKYPIFYTDLSELGLTEATGTTNAVKNAMADNSILMTDLGGTSAIATELGVSNGITIFICRKGGSRYFGFASTYNNSIFHIMYGKGGNVPTWTYIEPTVIL